ncbi:MAG TPA: hypothetical protein VN931_05755 [Fibrobacteria bacterium]|nr:hypothetical protein [Fibrobacteria bacterium]
MAGRTFSVGVWAGVLVSSALAATVHLSGQVRSPQGTGVPGLTVGLAIAGLSATTDTGGHWAMDAASGIEAPRTRTLGILPVRHLVLRDGRLQVVLGGTDLLGRPVPSALPSGGTPSAARALAGTLDTLVYSIAGIRLGTQLLSTYDTTGLVWIFSDSALGTGGGTTDTSQYPAFYSGSLSASGNFAIYTYQVTVPALTYIRRQAVTGSDAQYYGKGTANLTVSSPGCDHSISFTSPVDTSTTILEVWGPTGTGAAAPYDSRYELTLAVDTVVQATCFGSPTSVSIVGEAIVGCPSEVAGFPQYSSLRSLSGTGTWTDCDSVVTTNATWSLTAP